MLLLLLLALTQQAHSLDNGLAKTPQMGWNSWNHYGCFIDETLIKKTADALVSSGLSAVGFNFLNLDDCWMADQRNTTTNELYGNPTTFPSGMKSLGDYIHGKGLKYGLYSSAGYKTCQGLPASLGYESIDANTWASWGVDYLKYDNCNTDGTPPETRYPVMRDALNATGRRMLFSMCEWGVDNPATWATTVGNSWRTTGDINDNFESMIRNAEKNNNWWTYAGPGGWNDPDMLEVGNLGLSHNESMAHFSLWALVKSPLLIGCNVVDISSETLSILTNTEVIAINQDSLGAQGRLVTATQGKFGTLQVWAGSLSGGSFGVLLMNAGTETDTITAYWRTFGAASTASYLVRDLWLHKDLGHYTDHFSAVVPARSGVLLKLSP